MLSTLSGNLLPPGALTRLLFFLYYIRRTSEKFIGFSLDLVCLDSIGFGNGHSYLSFFFFWKKKGTRERKKKKV